jgi:adenine-specific DNA-methyltransferase
MPTTSAIRALSPPPQLDAGLGRVREMVRELARSSPAAERMHLARAFCRIAVGEWWNAASGHKGKQERIAPCPVLLDALDSGIAERAERFGRELALVPTPLATYLLSITYAGLLPDDYRAEGGVFYTPPALVERLLNLVEEAGVSWTRDRVIDPAAGGGAFLAPVAERMADRLARGDASAREILSHISTHLAGVELDPFSAWMSHVFLELALWEHCTAAGERLPEIVTVQNALTLPDLWRGGYDLVIGNPPYGRVTLDPGTRRRYGRSLFGHANLYGLFTDLAVRLCRPGGVVGLVTPASFLGGQYFKQLRKLLLDEAPPVALDLVTDRARVFDDVLQETVLVTFARGARPGAVKLREVRPSSLSARCRITDVGAVQLTSSSDGPWALPRTREDAVLLDRLRTMPFRLADYGLRVSTGPLVWNRHKPQLADERLDGCYPLVWAESVLTSGKFHFRAERRNHAPYFRVLPGQGHLLVHTPVVLLQRTTAKEQSRRLVAAVLPQSFLDKFGGAVVENHLNMIRPVGVRPRVPLSAVAALLNSDIVDQIFRCTSGSVAVSAYELESIPVPSLEAMQQLHTIVEAGASTASIEAFLRRAYGQPTEAAA